MNFDDAASVVAGYEQRMALIHWWSEPRATESQSAGKATLVVAQEFIAYYSRCGGCSNCGGLPHTTTCFVGRFQRAQGAVSDEVYAVDRAAPERQLEAIRAQPLDATPLLPALAQEDTHEDTKPQ